MRRKLIYRTGKAQAAQSLDPDLREAFRNASIELVIERHENKALRERQSWLEQRVHALELRCGERDIEYMPVSTLENISQTAQACTTAE